MTEHAVEFRNVSVIYGPRPSAALELLEQGQSSEAVRQQTGNVVAVHAASLGVKPGELSVLMGLSGSGKSTLLRCVNGLSRPARGEALVTVGDARFNLADCGFEALRRLRTRHISMVFQQFALLPWRTVEENVGFGLELQGVPRARRRKLVEQQLELVHLERWGKKRVQELSGGMQQRVGLARALATDADILLMDEPFSALDPLIRAHLQDELLELQGRLHKTVIFVSHDLDEALKLGSRVAIMQAGRVVQYDSPREILLNPSNTYVSQFVAEMNPLRVLDADAVMRPFTSEGDASGGTQSGDVQQSSSVSLLQKEGEDARRARINGQIVMLREIATTEKLASVDDPCMVVVPPSMSLHGVVEARWRTGRPVLVGRAERVLGIIQDDDIYRAILKE